VHEYARWLEADEIDHSSKVIPVLESLEAKQWVLPTQQAIDILQNARSFAVTSCVCRSHYKRCSHPLEVCFILNDLGDRLIDQKKAKRVNLEGAEEIIKIANKSGLVHMSLYRPSREIFALCNCCQCCCHDLQLLMKHGRRDLVAQADFIAVGDDDLCSNCGLCIERCMFMARYWSEDQVTYSPDACYGCGLCMTTCPEEAIAMEPRH